MGGGVLCGSASKVSRFELITSECAAHDVTRMAELFRVSTSGYYKHVHACAAQVLTPQVQRRRDLKVMSLGHHRASRGTYRSPRITADLHVEGERVSEDTIAKIMAEISVEDISPRTFKPPRWWIRRCRSRRVILHWRRRPFARAKEFSRTGISAHGGAGHGLAERVGWLVGWSWDYGNHHRRRTLCCPSGVPAFQWP
jgi:hypothetical protein